MIDPPYDSRNAVGQDQKFVVQLIENKKDEIKLLKDQLEKTPNKHPLESVKLELSDLSKSLVNSLMMNENIQYHIKTQLESGSIVSNNHTT